MSHRQPLFTVAILLLISVPRQIHAALVLQEDVGTVYETTAIGLSDTTSSDMVGMEVLVEFENSTTQMATWAASGASGSGWSLSQGPGTTFSNDWVLTNNGAVDIRRLTINGRPGDTVFDRAAASSTNGSATGTDLSETTLIPISGGQDVTVTYQDAVALTGDPIVGDIWSVLSIEFENGLGGLLTPTFRFIQDTDNISIPGDFALASTPEPASLSLMCVAGLMIVGARRQSRRRRRTTDDPINHV